MKKSTVILIVVVILGLVAFYLWASSTKVREAEQSMQLKMMISELQSTKRGDFIRFQDGRVRLITSRFGNRVGHRGIEDPSVIDNTPQELAPQVVQVIKSRQVDDWRLAAASFVLPILKTNNAAGK